MFHAPMILGPIRYAEDEDDPSPVVGILSTALPSPFQQVGDELTRQKAPERCDEEEFEHIH